MSSKTTVNHNHQNKIAVINDMTGFGRCSLAASIPIISRLGVQCCSLPTAILSNHTGFPSYFMDDYTRHFQAYVDENRENKEEAWRNKMRYRAIVWSCPPHYYANFSNWLANCWGVNVVVEMESLNFTKPLETEDKDEALRDLARLYERMVMRRHTNGGYHNVVTELWKQCEEWNANIVIMWQHVACKNMATVQGILDEQGRELGLHLIWIPHDLMDPRTVSRRTMRDTVSSYMRTVMNAEPIDESLLDFADDVTM